MARRAQGFRVRADAVVWRSPPPKGWTGDGCTGVPDRIRGIDVSEPCRLHDWDYLAISEGLFIDVPIGMRPKLFGSSIGHVEYVGPGVYVPVPRALVRPDVGQDAWVYYGPLMPTRLEADWKFGQATALELRIGGVSDIYANYVAIRRLVGVRIMGKGSGLERGLRALVMIVLPVLLLAVFAPVWLNLAAVAWVVATSIYELRG